MTYVLIVDFPERFQDRYELGQTDQISEGNGEGQYAYSLFKERQEGVRLMLYIRVWRARVICLRIKEWATPLCSSRPWDVFHDEDQSSLSIRH